MNKVSERDLILAELIMRKGHAISIKNGRLSILPRNKNKEEEIQGTGVEPV